MALIGTGGDRPPQIVCVCVGVGGNQRRHHRRALLDRERRAAVDPRSRRSLSQRPRPARYRRAQDQNARGHNQAGSPNRNDSTPPQTQARSVGLGMPKNLVMCARHSTGLRFVTAKTRLDADMTIETIAISETPSATPTTACGCPKPCRGWPGCISILVDQSTTAGRSHDSEVSIWLVCSVGGDGRSLIERTAGAMRRRCQRNKVSGATSQPARCGRGRAAATAPSRVRFSSAGCDRSPRRCSTPNWCRRTMNPRSFERPLHTASRASNARNR